MTTTKSSVKIGLPFIIGTIPIILLILIYRPTFQTLINGSSHLMMIDVGETQAVLNSWGTLHPTGYPLFVILGNLIVTPLTAIGISTATAPGLVSFLWGILALGLVYILAIHLTQQPILAAALTFLLGLMRFVWLHNVVAEVYSFTFLLQILILTLALWQTPIRHRVYWLALIGGIGVFHHRTLILLAPALIYAAWPDIKPLLRQPQKLILGLLLGLLGFLPYLYLPIRARTDAAWVYADPDTWPEFWDQFNGKEAGHFFGWPASFNAFQQNFEKINDVLLQELSLPAILLGLLGLLWALRTDNFRRPALTFLLAMGVNYVFAVTLYTDILASIIVAINLGIAFGWLFLVYILLFKVIIGSRARQFALYAVIIALPIYYATWLYGENRDFIYDVTHDRTGLDTIALAENAPPNSTLMLAWGPRHFAVGFAQVVDHQLSNVRLVDHKADFAALLEQGPLITPEYTFYNQSIAWWEARLGTPIYLSAAGPYLVQIDTAPHLADSPIELPENPDAPIPVFALSSQIHCTPDYFLLEVEWASPETPTRNLSILVHLLNTEGAVIAQGDQNAPVYGWRPMTTFMPNEIITDIYPLPRREDSLTVKFGLYEQLPSGAFQNYNVQYLPIECGPE